MSKGLARRGLHLCFILLLLVALVAPAVASTVSFSDTQLVGGQFYVYSVEGNGTTLQGIYNTTDTGVLIPDNALVVLKPAPTDYFKNPGMLPAFMISLVAPFANLLVILAVVGGAALLIRRRR